MADIGVDGVTILGVLGESAYYLCVKMFDVVGIGLVAVVAAMQRGFLPRLQRANR